MKRERPNEAAYALANQVSNMCSTGDALIACAEATVNYFRKNPNATTERFQNWCDGILQSRINDFRAAMETDK